MNSPTLTELSIAAAMAEVPYTDATREGSAVRCLVEASSPDDYGSSLDRAHELATELHAAGWEVLVNRRWPRERVDEVTVAARLEASAVEGGTADDQCSLYLSEQPECDECLERAISVTALDGRRLCTRCECREAGVASPTSVFREGRELFLYEGNYIDGRHGWWAECELEEQDDGLEQPTRTLCWAPGLGDAAAQLHQAIVAELDLAELRRRRAG